jgi:hypothetical protein
MEKKNYVKPSMEVVKLQHQAQLLAGSFDDGTYIPNMYQDDMNKLA